MMKIYKQLHLYDKPQSAYKYEDKCRLGNKELLVACSDDVRDGEVFRKLFKILETTPVHDNCTEATGVYFYLLEKDGVIIQKSSGVKDFRQVARKEEISKQELDKLNQACIDVDLHFGFEDEKLYFVDDEKGKAFVSRYNLRDFLDYYVKIGKMLNLSWQKRNN